MKINIGRKKYNIKEFSPLWIAINFMGTLAVAGYLWLICSGIFAIEVLL